MRLRWIWVSMGAVVLCLLGIFAAAVFTTRSLERDYLRHIPGRLEGLSRSVSQVEDSTFITMYTSVFVACPADKATKAIADVVGSRKMEMMEDGPKFSFVYKGVDTIVRVYRAPMKGVEGSVLEIYEDQKSPSALDDLLISMNQNWVDFRYGAFEKG